MDDNRFDMMIKGMTRNTSRRQVFGGLLAGAAATLAGVSVLEAKKGGNGKGIGKGVGGGKGNGKGKGNGNGKKNGKGKATFCHRTGNGSYHAITVSQSARKAHAGHGDVECAPHPCRTYTGSCTQTPVTGLCDYTPANQGSGCGNGQSCDANGNCI
ncbi:MAG: hypothetical protein KY456_04555 [Chloroflexi bacterium]|nr:hypothetical protein [Chloroflexota bacterium]